MFVVKIKRVSRQIIPTHLYIYVCKCTNFNMAMNLVLLSTCLKLSFLSFTRWEELRLRDKNKQAKEEFFYLLRTFCPHLGSFCVVSSFTTFRPNFTSGLLQVILPRPQIGMLSLVTVSPVITAFGVCGAADRCIESLQFQVSIVRR